MVDSSTVMSTDFDKARDGLRREQVAPFQAWRLSRPEPATIREADGDLHNGWVRFSDRQVVELAAPYPWQSDAGAAVDEMHSWAMLDPLLLAHSATGSWTYLEAAVGLAEDWADHGATTARAWNPGSTAHRAHRLAYLVTAAAADDALDAARWRTLARLAERHARRLDDAKVPIDRLLATVAGRSLTLRLAPHLDVGTVSAADVVDALTAATDRRGGLKSAVTADHVTAVAALAAADADDVANDLSDVRHPLEDALSWLVTTDGQPANFGPTALEPVNGRWRGGDVAVAGLVEPFVSDNLRHALSAGAAGQPPPADTRVLDGADLLVIKPVWPSRPGAHGVYVAVERSTGHLVWHDRGRALLISPGTTAEALDGLSGGLVDSALEWLAAGGGSNGLASDPPIADTQTSGRVGVINESRFVDISGTGNGVETCRTVVVNPDRWIFVADWVTDPGVLRTVEQRFLLGPGLDAVDEGDHYLIVADASPVMWGTAVHGDTRRTGIRRGDEQRGGWWAPRPARVAPATQLGWSSEGRHHLLASVFSLVGPVRAEVVGPAWSFGFASGEWHTRISLNETGLADMQEVLE